MTALAPEVPRTPTVSSVVTAVPTSEAATLRSLFLLGMALLSSD